MKKKTLLILALTLLFACAFAIFASAEEESTVPAIPEWTETQTIDSILPKEGFDTTSRVMLKNSDGSYVVYPAYYILKCTDTTFHNLNSSSKEFDFGPLNTAVADTTGETYSYASVVRLEIPSGFVTIQDRIFRKDTGFTSLMTLKVPEGVTSMGERNFHESESIQEIELPNSLEDIATYLAAGVKSLRKVVMKGAVTIGAYAFQSCSALEIVEWGDSLETIGKYAFDGCSALESVPMNDGITAIKERAFLNCTSLKSVYIPRILTELGTSAFYGCTSLSGTVVIPETVTTLGANTFQGCSSIEKAIIKGDTMSVNMFINCSKLSTLVLTKDIATIGSNALSSVANGNFLTIYTGNDPERLKTLNSISRFSTKNIISYEQYLLDLKNGVTYNQNTIVYGANYCAELNAGAHTINDAPTCVLPSGCIKCDLIDQPALGHERNELLSVVYVAFDQNGNQTFSCTRCEDEIFVENGAKPIFGASGYSYNPGKTSLVGGFTVNWDAYNDYFNAQASVLKFGLIAVNAQKIADGEELLVDGVLNSDYGFQVEMASSEYSVLSCSIDNFGVEASENLNLIIALYIIDGEGNVSYIQSDSDYVNSATIGTKTFDTVTLSLVIANVPTATATTSINGKDE